MRLFKLFKPKAKYPLYQYYAQVHYLTCGECLERHGEIFSFKEYGPPIHEGCRCNTLEIPKGEIKIFKSKAEGMKQTAQLELKRREIFKKAKEKLEENPDESLELFQQAADIEIYLGEVEELLKDEKNILAENIELASYLQKTFIKYYSWKFGKRRYDVWPERMRIAREKAGLKRIKELFNGFDR